MLQPSCYILCQYHIPRAYSVPKTHTVCVWNIWIVLVLHNNSWIYILHPMQDYTTLSENYESLTGTYVLSNDWLCNFAVVFIGSCGSLVQASETSIRKSLGSNPSLIPDFILISHSLSLSKPCIDFFFNTNCTIQATWNYSTLSQMLNSENFYLS